MNWVQEQLDDEEIFPSKIGESEKPVSFSPVHCLTAIPCIHAIGVPFPKNFRETVKNIVRRLFRVYAHLYNHHFAQLCALSIEGKWNEG